MPRGGRPAKLQAIIEGEFLTRDLINTPANDMGPDELEATQPEIWPMNTALRSPW